MRSSGEEAKPDIFDPFWMFFADDFSDEETSNKKRFGRRSSSKAKQTNDDSSNSLLDFFIPEEDFFAGSEQREPSSSSAGRQQQQQQQQQEQKSTWGKQNSRRIQSSTKKEKDRRLVFGKKSKSKRNSVANNETSSWASERRDMPTGRLPKRRNAIYKKQDSSDADSDVFTTDTLPNFMEALATPWDPWGDQESTDESSVASYTDGSSNNDESTATASLASLSLGTHEPREPQEVQQFLVQFNPLADTTTTPRTQEVQSRGMYSNTLPNQTNHYSQSTENKNSSLRPRQTSSRSVLNNDANSVGSFDRFDEEYDVTDEGEQSAGFFAPQRLVCCSVKNKAPQSSSKLACLGSPHPNDEEEFPKLRMVSDDKAGTKQHSSVVAKIKDYKGNVPAHHQVSPDAFLATRGPQSLYEYDYDGAEHMDVAYHHFGSNPLSLLVIRHHATPPLVTVDGAVVQVEASTISMTDCSMRSGEWLGKDTPPLPITPGVDFVGKIFCIDKDISSLLHLSVGDRVTSLTRCGGNSRFISIDPAQLVKISSHVDPAEATCLAETYLSAFQVLHFGQAGGTRYRSTALKGKSILLLGAVVSTLGHAIFELATAAGVDRIFATATPKHFPHLRSLGIIPISTDPALWYDQLNNQIDLVLVSEVDEDVVPEHFKVLKESGHLIVIGPLVGQGPAVDDWEAKGQVRAKQLVCRRSKTKINMIDRTHDYSPFRQWEADIQKCKKDLSHLVKMLEKGVIKPNVLDRIPLNKVAKAQDMVESKRHASGFLVCEPWLRNKKRAVRL